MKRAAIITLYGRFEVNYGNKFQNYASETIYKKLGYKPTTLIKNRPFSNCRKPNKNYNKYDNDI